MLEDFLGEQRGRRANWRIPARYRRRRADKGRRRDLARPSAGRERETNEKGARNGADGSLRMHPVVRVRSE